jgi:hypothetical protein
LIAIASESMAGMRLPFAAEILHQTGSALAVKRRSLQANL